ncbi:MAG TPA: SpoIID/LytB domain-containing protein [Ignavibacteriaceae bacterium]|nr:SpoIID/LytB domain-containing protein [Ignavibacteriaceae bacterium]
MEKSEPMISVGILTANKIEFELYGDFTSIGIKHSFNGRFNAELIDNKIVCKRGNERIEISDEIIFAPQELVTESFLIKNVIIGDKFHWQRKENERFMGSLKLIKNEGKITAINILPIENYLISVIASEMSAKCPVQALKSHAIISRSWLLSQIQIVDKNIKQLQTEADSETEHVRWYSREEHKLFDFCNDDHCQRYHGITKVFTGIARQAVEETKGIVLMKQNEICDTRYSKCCGGITESYENVWDPVKHSYLKPIVDYKYEPDNFNIDFQKEVNAEKWIKGNPHSFCNTKDRVLLSQILVDFDQETRDFYRWKIEYSQEELAKIIFIKSGIDFGNIIDLIPIERGASGRLIKLKIVGTKKTLIIGKELEMRKFLSLSHLYSSAFIVEKIGIHNNIPRKFTFTGAGWGHGVGLCQIGAAVMASNGYLFDEILLHYFTDVKLKRIY